MRIPATLTRTYEFACYSASCRPPTSGGTGGSTKGRAVKAGHGMGQASWKMSPTQIARTRAADRALGRTRSITEIVKAKQAEKIGPARDVSPYATQGRAGSSPEQYRANQLLLIKTREKVKKRLAKKHKWDAKERNVKDEMYPERAAMRNSEWS